MTDNLDGAGNAPDEMAEYLQTFLDETEEQLDDLVETMLALEGDATNTEHLNEAFRLIHSIKGSAGMMGFDNITVLTHHLESRFERFRSGTERLDEPTMNLVLRCIDFLRQSNNRLREGQPTGTSGELLEEVRRLEDQAVAETPNAKSDFAEDSATSDGSEAPVARADDTDAKQASAADDHDDSDSLVCLIVRFRAGLPLADLKAQLIVARLEGLGDIRSTRPDAEQLTDCEQLAEFEVRIDTHHDLDRLQRAADVDGVASIEFLGDSAKAHKEGVVDEAVVDEAVVDEAVVDEGVVDEGVVDEGVVDEGVVDEGVVDEGAAHEVRADTTTPSEGACAEETHNETPPAADDVEPAKPEPGRPGAAPASPREVTSTEPVAEKLTTNVVETMRVDIDRLDNLMNLTGELVVNRARFVQISSQLSPALRKTSMLNRIRDFSDGLRRTIESLESDSDGASDRSAQIQQLRVGLELMDEQADVWENGRQCVGQISEAIDQLSRVSQSLQRGVLETRMVPVGPLFNRFKRVVRDLSKERGKRVNLRIRGDKTELDKRMIDELGDPLVHLVRNSIDHGLEPPDVRVGRGKPEMGTIYLEASHSGNNVFIHVRDDGGGIDVDKIKARLIENEVLVASAVDELSDEQVLDYIWHPGFSTAKEVTDISGRGVGMDVVRTRISRLNGTVEVSSTPQQGTTFTIRLPLTLAIIDCLLVRLRNVIMSIPIDDVSEIVSVKETDIVTVQGKQTFDVRGEFLPLVRIDDVFQWHDVDYGNGPPREAGNSDASDPTMQVVILHDAGKTIGLCVDELIGGQDIVVKSLSDNFMDIHGLSGASILGDGTVALMLDVGTMIEMAVRSSRSVGAGELPI